MLYVWYVCARATKYTRTHRHTRARQFECVTYIQKLKCVCVFVCLFVCVCVYVGVCVCVLLSNKYHIFKDVSVISLIIVLTN